MDPGLVGRARFCRASRNERDETRRGAFIRPRAQAHLETSADAAHLFFVRLGARNGQDVGAPEKKESIRQAAQESFLKQTNQLLRTVAQPTSRYGV